MTPMLPAKWTGFKAVLLCFLGAFFIPPANAALNQVGHWRDYNDGLAMGIGISGRQAFVASLEGLLVYDLSDPLKPRKVTTLKLADEAYDITVLSNRAYIACSDAGLEIVDISNPIAPRSLGVAATEGIIWDVSVAGNYAYLASTGYGLEVVDISDETDPRRVAGYQGNRSAGGVRVQGDIVYLGDAPDRFRILSVTNPLAPVLLANVAMRWPDDIILNGNLAYVADSQDRVIELDVTDPAKPVRKRTSTPISPKSFALSGNHLFVAASSEIGILDISPGTTISKIGYWRSDQFHRDLALYGDYAIVASEISGLHVVSVTNLTFPRPVAHVPTSEDANDIVVRGDLALVPGGRTGLALLDVTDPANPITLTRYNSNSNILSAVFLTDHYALIANGNYAEILDLSERTNITVVTNIGGTRVTAVATAGSLALVAVQTTAQNGGAVYFLRFIDCANPTEPVFKGEVQLPAAPGYIDVEGTHAYLAVYSSGFSVVDFSDPLAPIIRSNTDTPGNAQKMTVTNGIMYLADASSGMRIYSVTNASSPSLVSVFTNATSAYGVALRDSTVYVANRFRREVIEVDVSDITAPKFVASYAQPNQTYNVAIYGSHLYAADGTGGVTVNRVGGTVLNEISISVSSTPAGLMIRTVKQGGEAFTENELGRLLLLGSLDLVQWDDMDISAILIEGGANFPVQTNERSYFFRVQFE